MAMVMFAPCTGKDVPSRALTATDDIGWPPVAFPGCTVNVRAVGAATETTVRVSGCVTVWAGDPESVTRTVNE
jgi:hypothetical protein